MRRRKRPADAGDLGGNDALVGKRIDLLKEIVPAMSHMGVMVAPGDPTDEVVVKLLPAATRALGLLGAIFAYAVRRRICETNPVRSVERFADQKRERRLSEEEYATVGAALHEAAATRIWPPAVAACRFLHRHRQ